MEENKRLNENEEQKELQRNILKEVLTGRILSKQSFSKQLPFLVFCTFLAVIYIANKYHAEYTLRESTLLQEQLEELRAESITTASELMFESRQSQVFKMVQGSGLQLEESRVPPIIVD